MYLFMCTVMYGYLLRVFYALESGLGVGERVVNKIDMIFVLEFRV